MVWNGMDKSLQVGRAVHHLTEFVVAQSHALLEALGIILALTVILGDEYGRKSGSGLGSGATFIS
jgi:hypothetical protein